MKPQQHIFRTIHYGLLLCSLFLVLKLPVSAQFSGYPIRNYLPKEYNGFTQNWICVQDRRGILYFGNSSEVLEYDGVSWRHIPVVRGVAVRALCIGSDGIIYVGSVGDFGFLQPDATGNMVYHSLSNLIPDNAKTFADIWRIYEVNGEIYFHASEHIFVLKKDKIRLITPKNSYSTLSFLAGGHFYARERKVGLLRTEGESLKLIPGGELFADQAILGVVEQQVNDPSRLLILTGEQGFYSYNEKEATIQHVSCQDEARITEMGLLGLSRLNDSTFVVPTRKGLLLLDQHLSVIREINKSDGLNDESIAHVFVDKQNEVWLSTNNGISKVSINSPAYYYSSVSGFQGNIQAVTIFNDRIYLGTTIGMYSSPLNGLNGPHLPGPLHFSKIEGTDFEVWNFYSTNGRLFASSSDGCYEIVKEKGMRVNHAYSNDMSGSEMGPNLFYLGEKGGLSILQSGRPGDYRILHTFNLGADDILTCLEFNDPGIKPGEHAIWLTTRNTGMIKFVMDEKFNFREKRYTKFNDEVREQVQVFSKKNRLYFVSSKGTYEYKWEQDKDSADCFVRTLLEDYPGDNSGVHVSFWDSITPTGQKAMMGIRSMPDVPYSNYQNNPSVIWFGLINELVRFDGSVEKNYRTPFQSLVRRVTIGKDSVLFGGSFISVTQNDTMPAAEQPTDQWPRLAYRYNTVSFEFAAPFFELENQIEFSFQLSGFDTTWSVWSRHSAKQYTNLNEGDYVFRVKARNVYGKESDVAEYHFTILPPWYRTFWAYAGYFVLFVLLIVIIVRISVHRLRNAKIKLERIVEERTAEVVSQKEELLEKNTVIELAFNDIKSSINYAKRIQESILPMRTEIEKAFPNSFVLFKPRDVVSGDFYWFTHQGEVSIIACVDCTGHGVPGAFMSMIGNTLLNQIVNEKGILQPSLILNHLHERVRHSLKQNLETSETRDGMDISICLIDQHHLTLQYAGANRPIYIVHGNELTEIKPDKFSIGGDQMEEARIFTNHRIELKRGSSIYMSTDGYADQFGGPKGKKFMVKKFQEKLLAMQASTLAEQGIELNTTIEHWKGSLEQVDDILVIGLKIE